MAKFARCPKCSESESLSIIEIHEESGTTDFGRVYIDEGGSLIAPSLFNFSPGDPTLVRLLCGSCGYEWTPRRRGGASVSSWSKDEWENEMKEKS